MGFFVDGVWQEDTPANRIRPRGRFMRTPSVYRNWITADGSARPERRRRLCRRARALPPLCLAFLPVGLPHHAVPQAQEARRRDLDHHSPRRSTASGAGASPTSPAATPTPSTAAKELWEVYLLANPRYSGRVTVPTLWDKERKTIVNNELSEIIRMLNSAFDRFTDDKTDYYPPPLRAEIDRVNELVYTTVNNGVYRSGFATSQDAYEEACRALFETLDQLEERLSRQRWLVGDQITEADWRLFSTLIRFDAVYHYHFKCNLKRIVDYPEPVELCARPLPAAGRGRDRELRPHQAPLLRQPEAREPDRHRAARPGRAGGGFRAPHDRGRLVKGY